MKISFEKILFDDNFNIQDKIFYVSGNEETLIHKIEKNLIEKFCQSDDFYVDKVGALDGQENSNLFFQKKLTILTKPKIDKLARLERFLNENNRLIIVCENSKGDSALKKFFEKKNNFVLVYCYELNRNQKIDILNLHIRQNDLKIEKDAFWYIIENTENKYLFFENDIKKMIDSKKEYYSTTDVKKILTGTNNEDYYRLLFTILKKNSDLVDLYYLSINSASDLYKLIQVTKNCFEMIAGSENLQELEQSIPRYMFREKQNFITIYNKTNKTNKGKIFRLIFKTEKLIRKNSGDYFTIGNRFLLNLKKNIKSVSA